MVVISLRPKQVPLSAERIGQILRLTPRRMVVGGPEWPDVLREPTNAQSDWRVTLPFCETLQNAFEFGCSVQSIGMRESKGRCWTFLSGTSKLARHELTAVNEWLAVMRQYVAIRDGLCMSFALDFDRHYGDPNQPHTAVGQLRSRAKPYGGPATEDVIVAADELASRLSEFLTKMQAYRFVDAVVAMPPSNPNKLFDLPSHLAERVAKERGITNFSEHVRTKGERPPMKDVPIGKKVETLIGTLEVAPTVFRNRNVLLIDDLYQSGASANVVAMELLQAGASRVFGLFCEKTCRNDDNVR